MRSHLTRRVFRRLINNQPVVRHRPLSSYVRPQLVLRNARPVRNHVSSRTFLGLFQQKAGRDITTPLLDPGMEKMLELNKRLHLVARLPPAPQLVHAFRAFVESRFKKPRKLPIEDFHATRLLQTLSMIEHPETVAQGNAQITVGPNTKLDEDDLNNFFDALHYTSGSFFTMKHNALAKAAWKAMCARKLEKDPRFMPSHVLWPRGYIKVLCNTGDTALVWDVARKLPRGFWQKTETTLLVYCWRILQGFAKEGKESAMLEVVAHLESQGIDLDRSAGRIIAMFYARKDDVENTKKWFKQDYLNRELPKKSKVDYLAKRNEDYEVLLQFCLRNDELKWGQELISALPDTAKAQAQVRTYNAIFLASAMTGKSVDDIDRMISVMIRRSNNSDEEQAGDGVHILNGLIRYAVSKNDAYTAERYFGLFAKYDIRPDAQTYILQIEYRLLAGDIDGAMKSYDTLRKHTIAEDEDWPIMNKLLRTLISQPTTNPDLITGLTADLTDRKRIFPSETILSLCTYHLDRDEYFELVDLLQTYTYQYSTSQRLQIRDALVTYTLDPKTDTGRAWDTYMIFHQVFDLETGRDIRNRVMSHFFSRGRPDLGTHVFTRMSKHMRADTRPDAETYILAFEGIAKTAEPEALEIVHNLLKLDTDVEFSTRMLNGLMLAYAFCGMPSRALGFWREIARSTEGPTYESLHIAFRSCERAPFGYEEATKIMTKLRAGDIEITRGLFGDFVAGLSGQGKVEMVIEALGRCKEYTGWEVDFYTFAIVFNASPGVIVQREMAREMVEMFPALWEEAEKKNGVYEDERGIIIIKDIERTFRA